MSLEDGAVRFRLEFRSEQDGIEDDLLRRDAEDAELFEELLCAFSVEARKRLVWRFSVKRRTRSGIDVREHLRDVLLRERVEARPFDEHPPDFLVVAFDMRFLLRVVGVAEKDERTSFELRRVVFGIDAVELDHLRIAEFRAVVREDDGEKLLEEFYSRDVQQMVEDSRACLRRFRVPQEREHETARELEREENLSSD